jgi:septum formation protein
MKLVLASASPRRQELLHKITDDFTVQPADVDETIPADLPPEEAAAYLSRIKAEDVSAQHPHTVVIGCDTVVLLEKKLLGKPKDAAQAKEMLLALSDKTHLVITGVTVTDGVRSVTFSSETAVTFYPLSEADIDAYIATGEPFDKAGAYGIQGKGALLVHGIQGDYFSVMGLPVARLARILRQFAENFEKECKTHS